MAVRYRYMSCHSITRQILDPSLRLKDANWSWIVNGNGTLSGKITVPSDPLQISTLRAATTPKQCSVYVRNESNLFPWGGPIISRSYDPGSQELTVDCIEWRTWLYYVKLAPLLDMTADVLYSWDDVDQLTIARQLVTYALAGGAADGRPNISLGTAATSGKVRDLHVYGTALKSVGELLDAISQRDGGFEWTINTQPNSSDGLPQPYLALSYPQQGSVRSDLLLKSTVRGGNMQYGPVVESGADKFERFWATGAGQAPDIVFAQDTDPALDDGNMLLFEGSSSFSSVVHRTTLSSHARQSRRFYSGGTNVLPVRLNLDKPDVDSYGIGDRVRLLINDRWNSFDLDQVRIIEKKVDMSGAGAVALTLDLQDYTLPEVDAGGVV